MIANLETLNNIGVKPVPVTPRGSAAPLDAASLPGFISSSKSKGIDTGRLRVCYKKLNMDKPSDVIELEMIETRALRGDGVFVTSKKDFIFMDKVFMLISYIEESKA